VEGVRVVGSMRKINGAIRDGGIRGILCRRGTLSLLSRLRMASTHRRRCLVRLPWGFCSRALIQEDHTSKHSWSRGRARILTKGPDHGGLRPGRGLIQTKTMIRLKLRIWRSRWVKMLPRCATFRVSIALNGGITTLIANNQNCALFATHQPMWIGIALSG
jgi:hypothetical protein